MEQMTSRMNTLEYLFQVDIHAFIINSFITITLGVCPNFGHPPAQPS